METKCTYFFKKAKLIAAAGLIIGSTSFSSGFQENADKVTICHLEGNGNTITISVSSAALQSHLDHGDYLGSCEDGANLTIDPFEIP